MKHKFEVTIESDVAAMRGAYANRLDIKVTGITMQRLNDSGSDEVAQVLMHIINEAFRALPIDCDKARREFVYSVDVN